MKDKIVGLILANDGNDYIGVENVWRQRQVTKIEEIKKNGQMAEVTWYAVYCGEHLISEINGACVEEVCYPLPS